MNTHELIFVSVPSWNSVIGFPPEDIVKLERNYYRLQKVISDIDYWNYFTYFYSDVLDGHRATSFSALWHFDQAWRELDRLRRKAGIRK